MKKQGLNPDRANLIDLIVSNTIPVKGYQKTVKGKIVPVKQYQRKGDKKPNVEFVKKGVADVSAGKQQQLTKRKDLIQRQRKGGFTTPPEARKIYAEYKKINASLKKLVESLGGIENARNDDIYNKIVKEQAARVKQYFSMVKEFQAKEGKGKFAGEKSKPEKPKEAGKRGKKAETTPEEARTILRDYKKDLAVIKELVKKLGPEEAKNNPEYVSRKELNKKRMEDYWRLVKEFQQKEGKGQFGAPKPFEIEGKEYDPKSSGRLTEIANRLDKRFGEPLRELEEKYGRIGYFGIGNLPDSLDVKVRNLVNELGLGLVRLHLDSLMQHVLKGRDVSLVKDGLNIVEKVLKNSMEKAKTFKKDVIAAYKQEIVKKEQFTGTWTPASKKEFNTIVKALPKDIQIYCTALNGVSEVYMVSTEKLLDDKYAKDNYHGDLQNIGGFYHSGDGSIFYMKNSGNIILSHEIGHSIHLEYIQRLHGDIFKQWKDLYQKYMDQNRPCVSEYSKKNDHEFFAEAFEMYWNAPKYLEKFFPSIHELMVESVPMKPSKNWNPDKLGTRYWRADKTY